jgi:hypothetical protein
MEAIILILAGPLIAAERQYRAALRTLVPPGTLPAWCTPGALRAGCLLLLPLTCHFLATGKGVGAVPFLLITAKDLLGRLADAGSAEAAGALSKKTDGARASGVLDSGVLDTDSAATARRKRGFAAALGLTVDAVCSVCVWMFLLALTPSTTLSAVVLWPLVLVETCRSWQRLDVRGVVGAGDVPTLDSSPIKADSLARAIQLLYVCGTGLVVLPLGWMVRTVGRAVLLAALPLAVESARRACLATVVYVSCSDSLLTVERLAQLDMARAMGSAVVVGVCSATAAGASPYEQRRQEALQIGAVTAVIDEAPALAELTEKWLDAANVDFVVVFSDDEKAKLPRVLRASSRVVKI